MAISAEYEKILKILFGQSRLKIFLTDFFQREKMSKKSIFYQHPFFYKMGLKFVHKRNLAKRYQYMASFAREGDLVLEPGCGPAILADYLVKGVYFRGFDMNKAFVDYALNKHLDVYIGNALDHKSYCQADVVIACDILHHLKSEDRKIFIKHCFDSTRKKLIICEPARSHKLKKGIFYFLSKFWFEYIEQDGTNKPEFMSFWTRQELKSKIENGFGVIPQLTPRKIKEIGEDFIIAYFKEK